MPSKKVVKSVSITQVEQKANITYRQMINASLTAMLREYEKNKGWQDGEKEAPSQSLLYKRAEALLSFILPLEIKKSKDQLDIVEGNKWFLDEARVLMRLIEKDGFDPNPYTYLTKGQNLSFVDCAATVLELCILIKKHLSFVNLKEDILAVEKTASRAFDFLSKASNNDVKGRVAWAANEIVKFKKQSLTNVYFTSYAVKALVMLLTEKPWGFVPEKDKQIYTLVEGGLKWLIDRCDEGPSLPYFDNQKTEATYFDFALMITAMVKAYEYLPDNMKEKILSVSVSFIEKLPEESDSPRFMYFLPAKSGSPVFYDNRLSEGIVVTALSQIRMLPTLKQDTEEMLLAKLALRTTKLLNSRGAGNNLWNEDLYLVSSTMWGISGLLNLDVHGRTVVYNFNEMELYRIMRIALNDPRVVKAIIQVAQEELIKKNTPQ